LNYKGKRLEIINIYRIPATSSYGPCCSVTQYVRAEGKIKSPAMYRNEIFNNIKRHISDENITDVIIAGDYNQGINERAVQQFYAEIGVKDVHSKINNIEMNQLDKTYKKGSRTIDSIAASSGIMNYIEGSKLVNYSEIVETDHRGYIIDVAMEEYFDIEFSQ
jgi:hypothetical protein